MRLCEEKGQEGAEKQEGGGGEGGRKIHWKFQDRTLAAKEAAKLQTDPGARSLSVFTARQLGVPGTWIELALLYPVKGRAS